MTLQPIDYYDSEKLGLPGTRSILQREYKAIEIIRRQLPADDHASILDVGCGDGSFLQQLDTSLKRPYEYHGIDYSEYQVRKAQALPYEFRRCNLEEGIPYDDASFDLVYSGEVIEHIYNPDRMLEECWRVLKPGGLLLVSTPNLQAWYNRVLFLFGVQPLFYEVSTKSSMIGAGVMRRVKLQSVPVGHLRVFNHRGLTDLLENEGFDVLALSGAKFHSLPRAVQIIDGAFNLRPRLASLMVVTARKR
jgi:2-polyprenyl-3-methyl-5-hydroxy-6-metoxy-1,4-benzoquinol methylase